MAKRLPLVLVLLAIPVHQQSQQNHQPLSAPKPPRKRSPQRQHPKKKQNPRFRLIVRVKMSRQKMPPRSKRERRRQLPPVAILARATLAAVLLLLRPPPPTTTTTTAAPAGVDPNARATVTNPDQMIEERGEVSALYVGRVIGKGGEMIRDLQARSGARIDVDQNVPAGQPRVITYRGTRDTVDFAKQLVHMLSVQGIHENDLPLGRASQEILVIPSMSVGKVIGRGGEMIRELQSRSQAKIQIDHSGVSGMPPDQKQVTITGTADSVTKAKEMVLFLVANPMCDAQQSLNLLIDDKVRGGGRWGSGPPYTNLPNHGTNMQPQMLPQPNQGYNYPPGGFGQPQGYGAPMGGPQYPPQQQPPALQGYPPAAAQAAYGGGMPGGRETDIVYAQKQFMGRIIGSKGMTVNDLQRRSGCDIQINQDVPHGQDCEITIKGSREGIESVKNMIKEIIEVGPQHPYAGGMDSGYGGGGGGGGGYQPQQQQQGAYGQQYPYQQQQGGYGGQGGDYGQSAYGMPMGGGYGQPQAAAAPAMGGGGGGYHGAHQQQPQYGGGYPPQQPVAPPMQAAAASPWKAATAPDGQVYYYNERSGETQWEKPAGMP